MKRIIYIISILSFLGIHQSFSAQETGNNSLELAKKFEETSKKAESGDAEAQFNLGKMYYKGQGITKNYNTAFQWYSKAAAQGNIKAKNNIGSLYYDGEGGKRLINPIFQIFL
jgi:TPR repeat protein